MYLGSNTMYISLFNFGSKEKNSLNFKEMKAFDSDLDLVWANSKQYNSFIAVRNHEYLKILYSDKRFIKLKFIDDNKIVGWSISLCTKLDNHKHFGYMRLGSIVDCLSLKGYEKSIISLTSKILKDKESDLIVSNQSHIFWKNAFKMNSFIHRPSNYIYALSKILSDELMSDKKLKDYIQLTRGDGDGPIHL